MKGDGTGNKNTDSHPLSYTVSLRVIGESTAPAAGGSGMCGEFARVGFLFSHSFTSPSSAGQVADFSYCFLFLSRSSPKVMEVL